MSRTLTRPLTSTKNIQVLDPQQLTRSQRLERWAIALERLGDARLRTLRETEHEYYYERQQMREDDSPLAVAFDEPVLRSAGLKDDTFGEAARFFTLSDWELHNILCYCHFGATVSASEVATRVRAMQQQSGSFAISVAQKYALGIGALTCGIGLALLLSA
jgi:hypothetical protein